MRHTPASAAASIATLRQLRAEAGRQDLPFNVTLQAPWPCEPDIVDEFASAGVDRLVCYPWEGAGEHWTDDLDGFESWFERRCPPSSDWAGPGHRPVGSWRQTDSRASPSRQRDRRRPRRPADPAVN